MGQQLAIVEAGILHKLSFLHIPFMLLPRKVKIDSSAAVLCSSIHQTQCRRPYVDDKRIGEAHSLTCIILFLEVE